MERDFQSELSRGLKAAGWHTFKIPDVPHKLAQQARFNPIKPYDCFALHAGVYHALELKQVSSGLSLSLSQVQDHQEDALLAVEAQGGVGWVVCNFRVRLSKTQQRKRGIEVLDQAFAARIGQIVSARIADARTGLPLDWWERNAVELPRQGEGVALSWDPTPLAEAVA